MSYNFVYFWLQMMRTREKKEKKSSLLEETWLGLNIYTFQKAHLLYLPLFLQIISTIRRPCSNSGQSTVSIIPLGRQRGQFQVSMHVSRKNILIFSVWPLSHGLFFEVHCFQELWASRCLFSQLRELPEQFSLPTLLWVITLTRTIFSWDRKSLHEISRTTFCASLGSPTQEDCLEEQGKMESTLTEIFTLSYPWIIYACAQIP